MSSLQTYESMSRLSGQMAEAARANDWDRLVLLERECAGLARTLENAPAALLSTAEHARKIELIHRILDDDAEVRRHTEPWMEQVKQFLGGPARDRKLRAAYGVR